MQVSSFNQEHLDMAVGDSVVVFGTENNYQRMMIHYFEFASLFINVVCFVLL